LTGHYLEHDGGSAYLPSNIEFQEIPNNFSVASPSLVQGNSTLRKPTKPSEPQWLATTTNFPVDETETEQPVGILSEDEITKKQLQRMVRMLTIECHALKDLATTITQSKP
jgi:hypothetical protein